MIKRFQEISNRLLLDTVKTDNIVEARRLVAGVNQRDRKSIVARRDECDPLLFVAVMQGNVDMVEFLVKECHADTEERGRYEDPDRDGYFVTPLWLAAVSNELEVLNCLINLGADINAASYLGRTAVLAACSKSVGAVKCLVKHGADVKRTNDRGESCLMMAVRRSKEICQILIGNGVEVNAQDSSGDTALHWAIGKSNHPAKEEIVQLLIDHGSDPNIKNENGKDVVLTAILNGEESILSKLLEKIKPPVKRRIESYELLGALHFHRSSIDIEKVVACWKKAIEMRRLHSCFDVQALPPNPAYLFAREVNKVQELETLSRNHDLLRMHALMLSERILGQGHITVRLGLFYQAMKYQGNREFRRCIDIFKYAYQIDNVSAEQLINPFYASSSLCDLCSRFCTFHSKNLCRIEFEEVFEVLQMATYKLNVDGVSEITLSQECQSEERLDFRISILKLMKLITELDKNEDQLLKFKKIVYRLLRTESKTQEGETLLHLSVKHSMSDVRGGSFLRFPSIAVVELLIECGANVNAIDNKNNTVMHICLKALRNLKMTQYHDLLKQVVVILLKNNAHVDMVNTSRGGAASLASSLMGMNIQCYSNLKCLAAGAVQKFKISYAGYIPSSLESFVKMHGPTSADPDSDSIHLQRLTNM